MKKKLITGERIHVDGFISTKIPLFIDEYIEKTKESAKKKQKISADEPSIKKTVK
jgi:hypothetical protein